MLGRVLVTSVIMTTVLSCGGEESSKQAKSPEKDLAPDLNEVQLSCRTDDALEIGQLNLGLGSSCSRSTMDAAYSTYDLGSFGGYRDASRIARSSARMCACVDVHCDEPIEKRAAADLQSAIDEMGQERDREAARMSNQIASKPDSCVEAPIAVQLLKVGYDCGFDAGIRSALVRKEAEKAYAMMVTGDPDVARSKADDCISQLVQTMPARKK